MTTAASLSTQTRPDNAALRSKGSHKVSLQKKSQEPALDSMCIVCIFDS